MMSLLWKRSFQFIEINILLLVKILGKEEPKRAPEKENALGFLSYCTFLWRFVIPEPFKDRLP